MSQLRTARPSPAIVIAVAALVAAFAGSALAGSGGMTGELTKQQVKKIAKKQANKRITRRAPGLSVANAESATNAASAANAENAANAQNAANAEALGGEPASAFERAGRIRTGTVSAFDPAGTEVLTAPSTGARVELGSSPGFVRIANTSGSQPLVAAGMSTFGTTPEGEFASIPPGGSATFTSSTLGPHYLNLILTLQGSTPSATGRTQLTCGTADAGGGLLATVSCVAVG